MFKRLMVPLDFTTENQAALARAGEVASSGAEIILLHVIETIPHLDEQEDRQFYDRLRNVAEHKIVRYTAAGRREGVRYRDMIVVGKRPLEIVRIAAAEAVELIVMNSHRPQPGDELQRFGSTSQMVATWSSCDVWLIKN